MSSSASVTTIIPTFRRPKLLRRAILSALKQTHANVAVCVYDNASGDETESVVAAIKAQDPRVSYFCHPQQVPVAQNFQFGLERVQTRYFSFLSDDDVLFPRFYEAALAHLEAEVDALFAAGSAIEFDQEGMIRYAPLTLWTRDGRFSPPEGFVAMLGNKHPTFTAILFRREVIEKVGALDVTISGPADLDYELRIASRFPYLVFFEPSAAYVHHGDRISTAEDASIIDQFQRISDRLSSDGRIGPELRAAIPNLLAKQMRLKLYEIAVKSLVAGKDDNAIAAATLLRRRFRRPLIAASIVASVMASQRIPAARKAFAAVEAARLAARAKKAQKLLRARIGEDASRYSQFLAG